MIGLITVLKWYPRNRHTCCGKGAGRQTGSAQLLCKSAAERLCAAEKRIEIAERLRRELITETDCKLQDASRALKQAQSRIVAAEDRLTAVEFRALSAEVEAREAKEALALVEEAIRRRLLCASPEAISSLSAQPHS
jgi:hypothetical protein